MESGGRGQGPALDDTGAAVAASVGETSVNPLLTTRTLGSGARAASEGTEEGATTEDAVAEEAATVEVIAKFITT